MIYNIVREWEKDLLTPRLSSSPTVPCRDGGEYRDFFGEFKFASRIKRGRDTIPAMSSAVAAKRSPVIKVRLPLSSEERVVLTNQSWSDYISLLKQIGESRVFVTFDGTRIEVMAPSWEHDLDANVLHSVIVALARHLRLRFKTGGSFTMKRADVNRGLEADWCYYFKNVQNVVGKKKVDLQRDPPPDLAVEVELTRRLLDRESIYAKLGVPELWRFRDGELKVFVLRRGKYVMADRSPIFHGISPSQISALVEKSHTMDDLEWLDWLENWIKKNVPRGSD